ncbi:MULTISPECIES: flavin reductase family protein [unclassified Nocardia]|uniref:flavin reductase family protein n=1 Tax=unclassified Nocardia TaxID=2637762 RepID=UPI0036C28DD2
MTMVSQDGSALAVTDLKAVLARFCTGVTVVTAHHDGEPVGFTCQSFASLSLDPPYVMLCPARTSTTWPRIRAATDFCVNILAADQEALCRQFGRSGSEKFAGIDWAASLNGSPLLAGAIASLDCSLEREVDGGDHTVVIARVTGVAQHSDMSPLLFYRSAFAAIEQET